jgi:hypothetical protein
VFPTGAGCGCGAIAARSTPLSHEFVRFVGAIDADAFATASLSLALYTLPHLLGHTEALAAPSLVARARIGSGQRFMTYGTRRGLAAVSCGLVEVTREVAWSTKLKVALGTPILGIAFRRVLHHHPRSREEQVIFMD